MKYHIAVGSALVCSILALAQAQTTCKGTEACLSWRAPTRYTDGTSIPAGTAITYRIYRQTNGIMTGLSNTTSSTSIKLISQPRGEQCYAVTANIGGSESVISNIGCKLIRSPGPTDGSIERPTDGGIERN
jgi:hypothetical protein